MSALSLLSASGLFMVEASYVPQIWRLYKLKQAYEFSYLFPALNILGRLCGLLYSSLHGEAVFGAFFIIGIVVRVTLLLQVAYYRKKSKPLVLNGPSNQGVVLWLTGLSGAGKSTLSDLVKARLAQRGVAAIQIDGDAVRSGLSKDLGFSEEDRDENIRRSAELARLLSDQGTVAICSFISPLRRQRALARDIVGASFMEVFVECSLEEVIRRDVKGLYARALRSEIPNFTGVSAPYEAPESPDVLLNTEEKSPEASLDQLMVPLLGRLGLR